MLPPPPLPPLLAPAPTHSASSTTRKNFFVAVHGTPLSICSQTVWLMCSPWSSHSGLPRLK